MHNPSDRSLSRRQLLTFAALSPMALGLSQAGAAELLQAPVAAARRRRNDPLDLNAANWATWLSSSPAKLLPPAPPKPNSAVTRRELQELVTLQNQRSEAVRALVSFWDPQGGIPVWTMIFLETVKATNTNPVLAARGLALLHTAIADATVAVWNAKARYKRKSPDQQHGRLTSISAVSKQLSSYASEHAAVASAAATVLNYLFPANTPLVHGQRMTFDAAANEAALSRLWAGANFRSDLVAGQLIGEAIGRAAVLRGLTDGSAAAFTGTIPTGPQYWVPTPPAFQAAPLLPLAGNWNPWLLPAAGEFLQPDPGAYVGGAFTETFLQQVQAVKDVSDNLTDAQKTIAQFWADGGGTYTPPGHWVQIALGHVVESEWSTPRAARALALLSTGLADAAIACWANKYTYWLLRPVSAIRNIAGQPFTNPTWSSFIGTPPFPAYTSGHSTFSGAAASVLESLFPGGTTTDALGQTVTFAAASDQAKDSRLYGGIHYPMDNEQGLACGQHIAEFVLAHAENDGAGPAPE
jgi:membrane-associated phospholipid phosphatase